MYTYRDIVLGITTFNRRRFVEAQGRSLKGCTGIADVSLVIIDDQSTEFTVNDLRDIYPSHAKIIRSDNPAGGADLADIARLRMLRKTECKIFVLLDSDLLCSPSMIDEVIRLYPKTEGFFSLFNTPAHATIGRIADFVIKQAVGSAGWVISRQIAEHLAQCVPPGPRFDYRCCEVLKSHKIPVLSVKNSLVQHAGFAFGQWSSAFAGDYGIGFVDCSLQDSVSLQECTLFAMRAGFVELIRRSDMQQREIAELKAELALHRFKLDL